MILETKNIFINQASGEKEDIIRRIGDIFASQGYTNEYYTQAMLDKEKVFNTYIGTGVAIPHGIEEAKKHIKNTGLVLMTFPDGQDWGAPEKVKVVIGIAAVGDEHLDVLQRIAMTFCDKAGVEKVLNMSEQEISQLFEGEE